MRIVAVMTREMMGMIRLDPSSMCSCDVTSPVEGRLKTHFTSSYHYVVPIGLIKTLSHYMLCIIELTFFKRYNKICRG